MTMHKSIRGLVVVVGALGILLLLGSLLLDVVFPDTQFTLGPWTHAARDSEFGVFQQMGSVLGFVVALVSFILYRRLA